MSNVLNDIQDCFGGILPPVQCYNFLQEVASLRTKLADDLAGLIMISLDSDYEEYEKGKTIIMQNFRQKLAAIVRIYFRPI